MSARYGFQPETFTFVGDAIAGAKVLAQTSLGCLYVNACVQGWRIGPEPDRLFGPPFVVFADGQVRDLDHVHLEERDAA